MQELEEHNAQCAEDSAAVMLFKHLIQRLKAMHKQH